MLFEMIDADASGTIEAAEFIGPLSRWAHDSKTAPRFIKYNMLQTMQLQEDLYDMCADCFKHLALQIDKVNVEVKGLSKHIVRKKGKKQHDTTAGISSPQFGDFLQQNPGPSRDIRASFNDEVEKIPSELPEEMGPASSASIEAQLDLLEGVSRSRISQGPDYGRRISLGGTEQWDALRVPAIPEAEMFDEMEHHTGVRASKQTEMLSEKLDVIDY